MKLADLNVSNVSIVTPQNASQKVVTLEGCLSIKDGKIISVGECVKAQKNIDGKGMLVIPGFVDAHTHIPFVGERANEFTLRASGKGYAEILKSGGGIYSTVEKVRRASTQSLVESAKRHAAWLLKAGVTTFECKSGYGLDKENELKQLRAIKILKKEIVQDVVATFLGAHAVPQEGEKKYLEELKEILEVVKKEKLCEYVDVFCDEGAFSVDFSCELLEWSKLRGFKVRAHAEELSANGFAAIASKLGAVSVDHLLKIRREEMETLAENGTIAVLMPNTSFFLKSGYAPGRELIDHGVTVALGSDFNPGSNTLYSPLFTMHLAVNHLGMTAEEALCAHTLNAARVLGVQDRVGSLEVGKEADFLIIQAPSLEYLPYMPTSELIKFVFKGGRKVFENRDSVSG